MAKSKTSFIPTPRFYSAEQVAARLGKSENWFRDHRSDLESRGFPKRSKTLDGWDAVAIEHYCDVRSGLKRPSPPEAAAKIGERIDDYFSG